MDISGIKMIFKKQTHTNMAFFFFIKSAKINQWRKDSPFSLNGKRIRTKGKKTH